MAKLASWGSSVGLRIPQKKLNEANLRVGDDVNITIEDGKIVIFRDQPQYSLKDLLNGCTSDNLPNQIDFGAPVGRELL